MRIVAGEPVVLSDGEVLDPTKGVGIFDAADQLIPFVASFDTETCEIWLRIKIGEGDEIETDEGKKQLVQVIVGEDCRPFVAKFILPGAHAKDSTGRILK